MTTETERYLLSFDSIAAREAAAQGMERAERAARVQIWKAVANKWLETIAPGEEFTADDLIATAGLPDAGPGRNNVVGAWISAGSKLGLYEWTGRFKKSERVVGHGNLQRVWIKK